MPAARPRYSTASAAAAAVAHGDGYKPREERGWEEFHPELELESPFAIIGSDEVDGIVRKMSVVSGGENGHKSDGEELYDSTEFGPGTPSRRRPGRPNRRPDSMLNGIGMTEAPKIVPLPGPNPRERLTLPQAFVPRTRSLSLL